MRELTAVGVLVTLCLTALNGGEPEKRTPAEELKGLRGVWKVSITGIGANVPEESGLVSGAELVIDGNRITHGGKTVLTITNDVPLPSAEKEIGIKDNRLMMLTLPDGRGFLCSYRLAGDELRIQYPHTSSCPRTGCLVNLKRPSK